MTSLSSIEPHSDISTIVNYAAVMGILTDANLDTEQYGTLSLLFYVAFLAFEFPHAYLMQRLPTAKYLGSMVICWGVVVACTSACNSYGSLVATRFLLGTFESAISPSLILITSMWYRQREQPIRIGIWYIGVGMATIVGGLMSYGFQFYHGTTFKSWQIMFLVVGLVTITVGASVVAFMPDNPMSARRLTHAERVAAVERLRENQTGVENKVSSPLVKCIHGAYNSPSTSNSTKSGNVSPIPRPGCWHSSLSQPRYQMAPLGASNPS